MKKPVRSVVVEYKNKRARKGNASLWGSVDLKSISRELEVEITQSYGEVNVPDGAAERLVNATKDNVANELSVIKVDEKFEDNQTDRRSFIFENVELKKEAVAPDPLSKPVISEKITTSRKNSSVLGVRISNSRPDHKATTLSVTDMDMGVELTRLESENASLRRELAAKLRLENSNLSAMLVRMDRRTLRNK